jgi:hypothetical protein
MQGNSLQPCHIRPSLECEDTPTASTGVADAPLGKGLIWKYAQLMGQQHTTSAGW